MASLISLIILFALGSILVVGVGIAIQLSMKKDNEEKKESDLE